MKWFKSVGKATPSLVSWGQRLYQQLMISLIELTVGTSRHKKHGCMQATVLAGIESFGQTFLEVR